MQWMQLCGSTLQYYIWDCSALRFLVKRFKLHALYSRKKREIVIAPKDVLHKLQFFMELLHDRVCGAVL